MEFYEIAHALNPKIFVGIDFVGYEDDLPLSKFYGLFHSHFKSKPTPKLFLHAGESALKENKNCLTAIENDTLRIGHGLGLIQDPSLLEKVKNKNILVEANPLSNWILGYVLDLRWHPVRFYPNYGIKVR